MFSFAIPWSETAASPHDMTDAARRDYGRGSVVDTARDRAL